MSTYRPDIDGLRALAVSIVLIFHAYPTALPGGFVGVDVFFVISGFLITGILVNSMEEYKFSLWDFYQRRIRRIFPALITVVATTFALAWVTLVPAEMKQLGGHTLAAAAFSVNLALWSESGYFDTVANSKPLLHLWSLGVEEQFYLVWPLLLTLCFRIGRRVIAPMLMVLGVISFSCALFQNPTAAFFSPVARFWELLVGGAVAISLGRVQAASKDRWDIPTQTMRILRESVAVIGFIIISLSAWTIDATGGQAMRLLLPVLGSVALIWAAPNTIIGEKILSRNFVVFIGKISYPLYLWHWPLLTLARIHHQSPLSPLVTAVIVLIAFILSWLTYVFIEQPVRNAPGQTRTAISLLGSMLAVAIVGACTLYSNGFDQRLIASRNQILLSGHDGGWPATKEDCQFMDPQDKAKFTCWSDTREQPRFAIVGDSKAGALGSGLFRTSQEGGRWIYFGSTNNNPLLPVIGEGNYLAGYDKITSQRVLNLITEIPSVDTVVIAMAARVLFRIPVVDSLDDLPSHDMSEPAIVALEKTVQMLLDHQKNVVLVIDNPAMPGNEICLPRKFAYDFLDVALPSRQPKGCTLSLSHHLDVTKQYRDVIFEVQRRHPDGVRVFDTTPQLCVKETDLCPKVLNDHLLYGVTDHISDYAAGLLGNEMNAMLTGHSAEIAKPETLLIKDWGPQSTAVGVGFNIQPDGRSALWIRLQAPAGPQELQVEIDSEGSDAGFSNVAHVDGDIVTSFVPNEILETIGKHTIYIVDSVGSKTKVGDLTVLPN